MNMFKSDEGSTAPPPVGVPPRPSNEAPSIVSKAPSSGSLEEGPNSTQKPWMLKGVLQKVNPFRFTSLVPKSDLQNDSAGPPETGKELKDTQNSGMIAGMMQKVNPFKSSQPKDTGPLHSDLSFSNGSLADSNNLPEKQEAMEVEMLEMAEVPVPSKGTVLDPLDDEEGLLAWWRTVEDWDEWTEANQNDEEVVEQVADRVFMAARLFVHFFNQRGVSLQQRILELLDLADTADIFHKKTVTTSVGGGVASVAGSITTITGLILAPFTAGTSLIVTAVGIGIATAGGVASASANITDTVHSKMDRKKVEKMIQDYQEEMKDIKECLEFLQTKSEASVRGGEFTYKVNAKTRRATISCWTLLGEKKARRLNYLEGMETLEEWNFEKYAESISKKHLNQNVKHVMKEGGRAGKALVINTESLISTIQVLNVAGGAAKAAQVMSVTTGLMSGLFLALDVFFLAKDSMELKKGAKTEFAAKIREVCKDLQNGLLELNRIKEQVQKTMDGIEVEVEEGELLKSDLKKLVELKK